MAVGWTLLQRLPLTKERLNSFAQNLVGIGAALGMAPDTGNLQITQVLPGTPAEEAGLAAGIVIQLIDDVPTMGKDLAACVNQIRGPAGTKATLVVLDPKRDVTRTVELTRRKIRT